MLRKCRRKAPSATVELPVGDSQSVLEYRAVIDGYTFQSVSSETVSVSKDGKATPSIVTFTYEKNATTASLIVHYVNKIGADLVTPQVQQLSPGSHTIYPDESLLPTGYVLSSSALPIQVVVGSDLSITPNSISFTCYDGSITGQITVQYYDTSTNGLIASETRSLTPGSHTVQPDESLVRAHGTYTLSDVLTNTAVEVREDGSAYPTVVNFYYKPSEVTDYQGYLLTTRQTAMRKSAAANGEVAQTLSANPVLWTAGQRQSGAVTWHSAQTATGTSVSGWVNDADVRRITATEAAALIEEAGKEEKEPIQNTGYYITLMDSVPLRQYANSYASAKYLDKNTVVYVYGQVDDENGYVWHKTTHSGTSGYVRDGQLRKLTDAELERYQATGNPLPTTSGDLPTYNPSGASSYGYVTSSGVNFRATPSMKGARLGSLNRYAMAMVIGTKEVDGVTWYQVNYSGTTGWIHGDYFHQMSLTEFNSFIGSTEYYQGVANNSTSSGSSSTPVTARPNSGSTGSSTQGKVESVEDWNVGTWQNTGVTSQTSYAPFNPYATPSATATAEAQATVSPTPSPTFAIGTMIPITYEDESKETQTSTVPWGLIGGAIVLLGGAGGVYAYALNQNKRRKAAAARAAANRRMASAGGNSGTSSPYARRAVAAPPAGGTQQPTAANPQSTQNPYTARPYSAPSQNPYAPTGNPYAAPVQPQSNPYAPPASQAQQPVQQQPAQTGTNPYARPISTGYTQTETPTDSAQRRRSRMQRYHDTESSDGKSENL